MTRKPTNIAASVYNRLLQRARDNGEDFHLTLQRHAVVGLLSRLEQSVYRDRFVLKGAMLYAVWSEEVYRPTRDLDLLGSGSASMEGLGTCFRIICTLESPDDGLQFLPDEIRLEEIREKEEYGGIRVKLPARLASAQISLQVDVGFGDVVVPRPKTVVFPSLLDGKAPHVRAYSRESVIAEKLHAAVRLGDANSRMKDLYDLYSFARLFSFEGSTLTKAIAATFDRRRTALPAAFPLRAAFFELADRAEQWRAYLKRTGLESAPRDFNAVGEALRRFLAQPCDALLARVRFLASWPPGGPWH